MQEVGLAENGGAGTIAILISLLSLTVSAISAWWFRKETKESNRIAREALAIEERREARDKGAGGASPLNFGAHYTPQRFFVLLASDRKDDYGTSASTIMRYLVEKPPHRMSNDAIKVLADAQPDYDAIDYWRDVELLYDLGYVDKRSTIGRIDDERPFSQAYLRVTSKGDDAIKRWRADHPEADAELRPIAWKASEFF